MKLHNYGQEDDSRVKSTREPGKEIKEDSTIAKNVTQLKFMHTGIWKGPSNVSKESFNKKEWHRRTGGNIETELCTKMRENPCI